jgi:hypothetical protein
MQLGTWHSGDRREFTAFIDVFISVCGGTKLLEYIKFSVPKKDIKRREVGTDI